MQQNKLKCVTDCNTTNKLIQGNALNAHRVREIHFTSNEKKSIYSIPQESLQQFTGESTIEMIVVCSISKKPLQQGKFTIKTITRSSSPRFRKRTGLSPESMNVDPSPLVLYQS
jgi:hypothetical protein